MVHLKDLISAVDPDLQLYKGSAKELVRFDEVLKKNKHVVLFISDHRIDIEKDISKMKRIYEGIVITDVITIWLPIVKWTDKRESEFLKRRDKMPWYTMMYFSQTAGLKTTKKWNFDGAPLVVVMNGQGDVLSKHRLDQLPQFLDLAKDEVGVAQRTKKLLIKSDGKITEVLKALLGKDSLRLPDGRSTKKKVENLKDKYVLLFILRLDKEHDAIKQIKAVSAGVEKDLFSVVLILMGSEKTDNLSQKMKELQSDITYYTVQRDLPKKGIEFIQNDWYFGKSPRVVMMNPKGEVLSKHKFNHEFKPEPIRRATLPPQKEKHEYTLRWGGGFLYWNKRFSKTAKAVAADLKKAHVCIKCPDNRNLMDNYQSGTTKWATLKRDKDVIREGPQILNVLEAFDKWKGNLTLESFECCFRDYFDEFPSKEAIEKQTSETQGELLVIEAADSKLKSSEIIEKSGEECEASRSCPTDNSLELKELPKDVDWEKDEEICLTDGELPKNPTSPRLLTLSLQGNKRVRKIPESFFYYMPALQTLDLSSTSIRSLPDSIMKLVSLRRLWLKDCHNFIKLMPKVGALNQLEVLDLEGTDIIELPEEIKKLTNIKCLKVSICSFSDDSLSDMQSNVGVHCGIISELSHLNKLSIRVNPDDKWWIACVESIVAEVCSLESLNSLEFFFPSVELLGQVLLKWKSTSLSHFRFTVGRYVRRILSRLPCKVEFELEQQERCLKFINGEDLPKDVKRVLQNSTAFFLERHATVKKLSEFGIRNMEHLKCCVVGECNEVEVLIDEADIQEEDREVVACEEDESTHEPKRIVIGSLEYLYIYYMKNLMSIWKGPIQSQCLSHLKVLGLRTCPQLTTTFTEGLLCNLKRLEELTVEDCPSVTALVKHETPNDNQASYILQNLKKIMLHYMPGLVTISSVPLITPNLELMSIYYCPNLKSLRIEEESRNSLREIKGERSWWEALERHDGHNYLDDIFVPISGLD